ncbi:MAG TPA: ABC transporter permease [Thermotogota bacterium]|nr:ABC transporter permease [Thermotogota bacterium]HRW93466.1 ABC transporter permease [Thermotogota bacterium]
MWRRLLANLLRETKVGWRSYYPALIVGVALFYFVAVKFLLPTGLNSEPDVYYLNNVLGKLPFFTPTEDHERLHVMDDFEQMCALMKKDTNSIGIEASGPFLSPHFKLVFQGYENEGTRNLLKLSILEGFGFAGTGNVPIQVVGEGASGNEVSEPLPANEWALPVFILSEAVMLGMIFLFAMVFIDKSERTFSAYTVSPAGLAEYFGAKALYLVLLGFLFTMILTPLVVGWSINYFHLLLAIAVGSFFTTSIALIVSCFYDTFSQAMFVLLGLNLVLLLPSFSYFLPTFSPWYVRVLPTWSLLFGLRDILFPGVLGTFSPASLWLNLLYGCVAFALGVWLFSRRLRRA